MESRNVDVSLQVQQANEGWREYLMKSHAILQRVNEGGREYLMQQANA